MPALDISQGFGGHARLVGNLVQASLIGLEPGQGNIENVSHSANLSDISPVVKRHIAFNFGHTVSMTSRTILGANLSAVMKSHSARQKNLSSNKKVGDRLKISDNTVGRIRRGENSIGIDMLDKIAGLYSLQPWQLLVPEFEVSSPPMLRAMSEDERTLYDRLHAALLALENR